MRITVCCTDTKVGPWIEALQSLLPEARIEQWRPGAPQADHAVVWSPPQQFLDEQPRLKGIFNIGAGVDALLKLRLPPDPVVVRLDDAGMSVQMAEFVCHAVIRHFREFDAYAREGGTGNWGLRRPRLRSEFPVGVLGLGVLGQRVAQAVAGFEFPVLGWSRGGKEVPGVRCYAGEAELSAFLAATRVLVCLLPLTPETGNILNRESLSRLQSGGYLINVARGGHLVDEDLLALLDSGHLAGAALDVFRTEPLPADHPFWRHPKIVVTPHVSARTLRDESAAQIARKIRAMQAGQPIAGVVDRQRGY
ncbi:MAG: D-3-phosphoglycerate dehydrogenase (phosphoglycerate dehydrogenase)-like protein [Ramlibacter sp.]|jgi:glyoxylate/hydroxypyruvate reductase A|uniref:2-hydroxyacid dehydrogenase n=1 Tax=Ramlibacter sp. TaxID=1917967 RepID=UPI0026151202|nr:glyoxylate/hydroxypyruvate reductase A [Ramlibacter sp.]MDB5751119.1 D-3-phosphoglycerate dehydrogenase (phosphoglycerate dehydrogenase)-like protein [Ramlibacter sp.]